MNYQQYVNHHIKKKSKDLGQMVFFGQNIEAGSRLSGLSKNLPSVEGAMVINSTNCENTMVGIGMGLMEQGVPATYLVKQLDFLLLGIDQLTNTYNVLRGKDIKAPFNIVVIVVDDGYGGSQSALNNLYDFCSISRVPGYTITNKKDADMVMNRFFKTPGPSIIAISQRLFGVDVSDTREIVDTHPDEAIIRYTKGDDATIVCCNFTYPQGKTLHEELKKIGIQTSIVSVNGVLNTDWDYVIDADTRRKNFIVLDDSKSINKSSDQFVMKAGPDHNVIKYERKFSEEWFFPSPDTFSVDSGAVREWLNKL